MPLEGRHLGFRYGNGPWIFRNFDIALHAGETVGLFGPSGCGKTTVARILAGYDAPAEGSVTLDGAPLPAKGVHPVQLVFQHPEKAVNPRHRMRRILRESWMPDRGMLELFGIRGDWLDRWPNELSGGELQRFCILRALAPSTRFIIADEITAMLDAVTQAQIWHALMHVARERKLGLLVISHDRTLLERLCGRIIEWG
jgi:peptide/nickel transport system ATP-binding protein